MKLWARLSVMLAAVILTAATVVILKGMLVGGTAPPVQMPGSSESSVAETPRQVRQYPTILQAKPAIPNDSVGSLDRPRYIEWEPGDGSDYAIPKTDGQHPGTYAAPPSANPRLLDRPPQPPLEDTFEQHRPAAHLESGPNQATAGQPEVPAALEVPTTGSAAAETKPVHVTRAKDTWLSLAEEIYGSGAFYMALYLHNRAQVPEPDLLGPGVALQTPSAAELRRLYPDHCPPNDAPPVRLIR